MNSVTMFCRRGEKGDSGESLGSGSLSDHSSVRPRRFVNTYLYTSGRKQNFNPICTSVIVYCFSFCIMKLQQKSGLHESSRPLLIYSNFCLS